MATIILPENGTILLDTNFFLDLFEHEKHYKQFFDVASDMKVSLVSCDLVRGEFVRTKDKDKLLAKNELFSRIVSILPMDKQISELLVPTLSDYGHDIEGVSIADIILACFIKRYSGLYLLTRNHKDFPTRIFDRSGVFSIEHEKDVKTYALYQYRADNKKLVVEEMPDDVPF